VTLYDIWRRMNVHYHIGEWGTGNKEEEEEGEEEKEEGKDDDNVPPSPPPTTTTTTQEGTNAPPPPPTTTTPSRIHRLEEEERWLHVEVLLNDIKAESLAKIVLDAGSGGTTG